MKKKNLIFQINSLFLNNIIIYSIIHQILKRDQISSKNKQFTSILAKSLLCNKGMKNKHNLYAQNEMCFKNFN